jgi:hypothetical protein
MSEETAPHQPPAAAPDETALNELQSLWERELARGRDVPATELCRDRPDLTPELERRLGAVRRMNALAAPETVATSRSTAEPSPAGAAPPRDLPSLPGYELLGELGRGGMGVVYKARHAALGRVVALMMVLAGGAAHRARFRTEAEAVARLQHPNIVQVHEVGEHQGTPYLTLEFCGGGGLDKKLAGTPLPPAEAARLVETLARAVQAAHERHIIHRDLKPANVLLTEDGTPKVTDFGLAKKLDAAGQTQSGAVLGTPSYMAPEQAASKGREVGPAADVYALGAILYECLTGRPPFKAATVLDTLRQVLSEDPVPPRQLQSKAPRDLETICLKCLHKDPSRRYPSAGELAEELRRFQAGEPIRARPVGAVERAAKWARRRPAVAAMLATTVGMAAAAAALVGWQYSVALDERDKAVAARNELAAANDELETTLARSLLRPLRGRRSEPLTDPEVDALWELSAQRSRRVRYRFVAEALRGPATTRQLESRSGPALHAAVGLDAGLRAEVERALAERLGEPALTEEERTDVALVAGSELDLPPEDAARAGRVLTQALARKPDHSTQTKLVAALFAVTSRAGPRDRVAAITEALAATTNADVGRQLVAGLAAAADALPPDEAAPVCGRAAAALTQAMTRTNDYQAVRRYAESLAAVAPRLGAADAARAAATLVQAMKDAKDPNALYWLAEGLSAVAARLETKEAATLTATLGQALDKTNAPGYQQALARSLSAAAPGLETKDAAAALTRAIARTTNSPAAQAALADALAAAAPRLGANETSQAAAALTEAMAATNDPNALIALAEALGAVTARLEPAEAGPFCAAAATSLARGLSKTANPAFQKGLSDALLKVAARLAPRDAARIAAAITQTMSTATVANDPKATARGLAAITPRLEMRDAAATAHALAQALGKAVGPIAQAALAEGLAVAASSLEPQEVGQTAEALAQALATAATPNAQAALAEALAAVAGRLEPRDATERCAPAAGALVQGMAKWNNPNAHAQFASALVTLAGRLPAKEAAAVLAQAIAGTNDPSARTALVHGLSAAAPRLEPAEAAAAAAVLLQAITKPADPRSLPVLAKGLASLATRVKPEEANRLCTPAAAALIEAMARPTSLDAQAALADGVSSLTMRLPPPEAVATLTRAMTRATSAPAASRLAQELSGVAPRLQPREATRAADDLAKPLAGPLNPYARVALAEGLAAAAERLEPTEARERCTQAAAVLSQAMVKENDTIDPHAQAALAEGLSSVTTHLEPQEAARLRTQAAASLIRSMAKITDPASHKGLAEGVLAVTAHMTPAEAVATLAKALAATTDPDPDARRVLARGLASVVARAEEGEAAALAAQAAAALIQAIARTSYPNDKKQLAEEFVAVLNRADAPGRLPRAAAVGAGAGSPAPCRLAPQDLVDLLKQPLCTGEARRLVLAQLEKQYHRPFADHWDFVRFAHQERPELDLTAPARRP